MNKIGTESNNGDPKISFLELVLNIIAFAIVAGFDDHFRWWFFIIGIIISFFLSFAFEAEKYNKGAYIIGFIVAFMLSLIFPFMLPLWTWLIIWPIVYSIMVSIISRIKAKNTTCGRCKKEYAMEVYDTKFLGSENVSITKSHEITDVYGKQHTNYYEVPGTREYYMDCRRCKFCGYEDTVKYSVDREK